MRFLETTCLLALLIFLVAQATRRIPRRVSLAACAVVLAAVVLMTVLGQVRWQMAPAHLLWIALALSLLMRSPKHAVVRWIGATLGIVLLATSATLSLGMPIVTLRAPEGPFVVGTTSFTLIDESRNDARFGAPEHNRELSVRLWYPGQLPDTSAQPRPRTLWQDLYSAKQDLFTLLVGYLRGIETSSFDAIPMATRREPFPLVVFSHGMLGHPEQNTLLMEHLASHGYVVAAVGHPYMALRVNASGGRSIGADFNVFAAATSQRSDKQNDDVTTRLGNAAGAEERGRIWLDYFENSSGLNELMQIWVDDLRFAADSILGPKNAESPLEEFASRVRLDRVGVMGMSFGGGAVAEFCKSDSRCAAGLNLDGGAYGSRQREPLRVPYLAMIGPHNEGLNAEFISASRSDFYEVTVEGTAHNDFMDSTIIAPVLKWLDVNGDIRGERMIEITNAVSLAFFEAYMRDGPKPRFDTGGFPELTVETNR